MEPSSYSYNFHCEKSPGFCYNNPSGWISDSSLFTPKFQIYSSNENVTEYRQTYSAHPIGDKMK